jgi:cytochrome oxidase Cu insertion factor (SCO1/SenC/PrrC family)
MNRRSNPKRLANARSGFIRRRLFWSVAASLALVTAAFSLFASGLLTSSGSEPTVRYEIAPDIALATAAGNFQLSDHRGKVVVLYFSFPG